LATRRGLIAAALAAGATGAAGGYLFWRRYWFFRDPPRIPPSAEGLLSPADGTVVYVKKVAPGEAVVVIKEGLSATVMDIMHEDFAQPKLVIGIFMSPFDVHYNRAPLDARVAFIRKHPSRGGNANMGRMHWRSLLGIAPRYEGSMHIVQNERTVTTLEGDYREAPLRCYVVQIGALTVNGIDSYFAPGERVARGATWCGQARRSWCASGAGGPGWRRGSSPGRTFDTAPFPDTARGTREARRDPGRAATVGGSWCSGRDSGRAPIARAT
jgi:phosphatidylserine decarboxylase